MKFHYTEQQIKEMQSDKSVIRQVGTVGEPGTDTFLGVDFPQQFLTVFDDSSSDSLMTFDDIERIEKDDYHPWKTVVASGKGIFQFQRDVAITDKDGDKHHARIIKFFDPELDVYTRKILEINILDPLELANNYGCCPGCRC